MNRALFRSAFESWQENGRGRRPVVFDVLGSDYTTSLLPEGVRLVLHVNPTSIRPRYQRQVERIQTLGGYVEQHWGDAVTEISIEAASGAFMRLYSGLSNITNPDYGGTRRETIAYDKYLDLLALFKWNGSLYDANGTIVLQGIIKMSYDGGVYLGWFSSFSVSESAEKPFQFIISADFTLHREIQTMRSTIYSNPETPAAPSVVEEAGPPLGGV